MAPPDRHRSPRPGSGLSLSVLDLAQIRALVESTGMLGGSTCPSCEMPFDKGKKRRLIDSCGHERCYSCLFRSEACPLCLRADFNDDDEGPFREGFTGFSGPMSILAPTDGWIDESSTVNSLCGSPRPRTKVTTRANLPSRVMHQEERDESVSSMAMAKGLKNKPPALPESSSQGRQKLQMMTQSCPTPPNQRKRFFLNPKVLRSSFVPQRSSRRGTSSPEPVANDNPSALSAWMASSWEGKSRWPGVVLGKIKSLWSNSQGTANDGLNQLIDPRIKVTGRENALETECASSRAFRIDETYMHRLLD